jgi:hypothetical protein
VAPGVSPLMTSMNNSDNSITEVLRAWRVSPLADPDFRSAVWQRIERHHASWPTYLRSHATIWSLAAALTLGTAAFSGAALAKARAHAERESLVNSYLVDLDPRVQASLKP